MIASISGEIIHVQDGQVVINLNGLGMSVFVTEEISKRSRPGMKTALHTYLVVREEILALYGFESLEERELFIHLISVAGIGPRIALSVLSTLSPETIRYGIAADQPEIFTRVPGIGKKTAQKLVLELRGKIQPLEPLEAATRMDEIDTEVMEALTALGYSIVEAQAALQYAGKDAGSTAEERLRKALQYFT